MHIPSTMLKNTIHIFTTGGTIEKSYHEIEGSLKNRDSLLQKTLISKLRLPYLNIHIHEVMAKDSLFLSNEDRLYIWNKVWHKMKEGYPVVILHGTDSMEKTAQVFFEKCPQPPVPVIFTGAMIPMGFEDSDGRQNFTEALFAAHFVKPGVYISFHGYLFDVPNCRKNIQKRTFEKKNPSL
ncbi:MAG: asparaginase [Bdellovibrionaceae bacterium]|nr:asparaginase [Pseudobdellovibrionaceae bacterium]